MSNDGNIVIDTPDGIRYFQLCSQLAAVKLEAKGLRHSSGRSVTAHCKRIYNIKGNRDKVIAQMEKLREEMLSNKEQS